MAIFHCYVSSPEGNDSGSVRDIASPWVDFDNDPSQGTNVSPASLTAATARSANSPRVQFSNVNLNSSATFTKGILFQSVCFLLSLKLMPSFPLRCRDSTNSKSLAGHWICGTVVGQVAIHVDPIALRWKTASYMESFRPP